MFCLLNLALIKLYDLLNASLCIWQISDKKRDVRRTDSTDSLASYLGFVLNTVQIFLEDLYLHPNPTPTKYSTVGRQTGEPRF